VAPPARFRPKSGTSDPSRRIIVSNTSRSRLGGGSCPDRFKKPANVPFLGNLLLPVDADQPPQRLVAAKLSQAALERRMPQQGRQQHHTPQHMNRIVVAPFAPGTAQRLQQLAVGHGLQEAAGAGRPLRCGQWFASWGCLPDSPWRTGVW